MTQIRRLAESELATLQPLFAAVFKTPISLDLLHWKYAGGRGEAWTAWAGEQLLLHCGVCFRSVLVNGLCVQAAQLVDLMAAPKALGLARNASPFALLLRSLLLSLPRPGNPHSIAFGFPSGRAMRLGELTGVFYPVGQLLALQFAPASGWSCRRPFKLWRQLGTTERTLANELWLAMAADLSAYAVGVRDADYLQRRYYDYPGKNYVVLLAVSRWRRLAKGLAVLRQEGSHAELLDLVGPLTAMPQIVAAARAWLAANRVKSMTLLLPEPFAALLTPTATACTKTEFRIMANPFAPPETMRLLENRWWLTGGDTDYR